MTETQSATACPMSAMCKGMAAKPGASMVAWLPGLVMIGLGVLVIFYPQVLAWIVAALMIMMGLGVIFMAGMMKKFGARMHGEHT